MFRYPPFLPLLRALARFGGLGLLLVPIAGQAQSGRPLVLRTYHDSARTRPHTVYQARLAGTKPDTVAHGTFRRYWPGGSLQELGHFTEGQADSIWTRYYPAKAGEPPILARRLPMRSGKPEGAFTVWYPDGRVGQRGTFRGGQLVDSLVTYDGRNRVRLAARFQPDSAATGPTGTFQHWPRRYSFQAMPGRPEPFPEKLPRPQNYRQYTYEEPARDPRRYWRGQLQHGQHTDTLTEYNPNRQPRTRLVFDAQRRLSAVLRYYPVEQLISETYDTTITRSQVAERLQALGPRRLLHQRWAMNRYYTSAERAQPVGQPSSFSVYRTKLRVPHPERERCGLPASTASMPDVGPLMEIMAHVAAVRLHPYNYRPAAVVRIGRRIFSPRGHVFRATGLKLMRPRQLPQIHLFPRSRFKPRVRLWQKMGDHRRFRPRIQLWRRRPSPH